MRKPVIIIAEAGVNHNGDFQSAKRLVEIAADAGADYVKFQTFKAEKIVNRSARKAEYQIQNIGDGDVSQFSMLKKLEMPDHWHAELIDHAEKQGIAFLSTGFDEASIDFLDSLSLGLFKVPSGELTNKPYLQHIARKKKPIVLSTGMANMKEIADAIAVIEQAGVLRRDITVLHCNTEYPTPFEDVNLEAMISIKNELSVNVGYSDHTLGIEVPIAAVALGAVLIEKHFTLDRNLPGPDHRASLEPVELKAMVSAIRNIEKAISGSGIKEPSASEMKNVSVVRKSLHYKTDLRAGQVVTANDLIALRPATGISPMKIDSIIGAKLKNDVQAFEQVQKTDLE
jgi:N,N'-diacetyllegionaminate synthase